MTDPRSSATVRAAALSVLVAILVLLFKGAAWILTGSVALYSDAMESVVNVVAATAVWAALRYASRKPDENHPYGHAKVEYLSAVLEGVLIVLAAVAILREAVPRFVLPKPADLTGMAVAASFVASGLNAALAWFLVRSGRLHRSPALVADGRHVFSDVVTSLGVLIGIGVAWATGFWILDPILAGLVALYVVWLGWKLIRGSVGGLMDEGLDPGALDGLRKRLESSMEGAIEIHDLRTRRAGWSTFVEFHLIVPAGMSVEDAHRICDRLEAAVEREVPGAEAAIHVEPEGEAGQGRFIIAPHGEGTR